MAAQRGRGFAVAILLVAVGFVLAPLSVSGTASRIGLPVVMGPGLVFTFLLAGMSGREEAKEFLLTAMLGAIGIRLIALTLIHQSVGPTVFAPDSAVYEMVAQDLLQSWQGFGPRPEKATGVQAGYYAMNAILFWIFGRGSGAPVAINILLASWLAIPIYYLTMAVVRENHAVARLATTLTLFFPSLILWSVLNIREAPTIFLVVSATCFFARFQQHAQARDLIGAALAVFGIIVFRQYLMVIVALSAGAGVMFGKSRSPLLSLAAGAVIMVGLAFALRSTGIGGTLAEEPSLGRINYLRQDLALGAGSAYAQGADVSTVGGAVVFLPVGLTYFLLAPFPWSVTSILQAVTLPESLVWYVLFLCVIRGVWLALKYDPRAYTVLVAVLGTVTFSYALVEGNVGTAYRHRAQVLPLFFVLAAVGLRDVWGSWMEGRIRARAARRQAAATVQGLLPERPRAGPRSR